MKINSLETMEKIVSKNSNLFWEGWSVCTYLEEDGLYSSEGVYKEGQWIKKKTFEYAFNGWNIPDRFVKNV
jgi:hypothetical protein